MDDHTKVRHFLEQASGGTVELNRTRLTSELYLAHKTKTAGDSLVASLATLSQAFTDAATASDKHAKGLNFATWALVLATLLLAAIQLWTMFRGGAANADAFL